MDLAFYIYSYLQEKSPRVEVPNFGIFRLEKQHAVVDVAASKILPPSEHIFFEDNTAVFDASLAHYIVEKTGDNLFMVQSEIRDIVRGWIKILMTQKKMTLKYLGEFELKEIEIVLEESKMSQSVDFFGLEEVEIVKVASPVVQNTAPKKEISKKIPAQSHSKKGIIWLLVILGVLVASILIFVNREVIFGKEVTKQETAPTPTAVSQEEIKPIKPVKGDSIVIDSTKVEY